MRDSTSTTKQVSQTFPARWMEKQTIFALDDKVVIEHKSILHEYRWEYDYAELKPRIMRGRAGDPAWSNIGWYLIALAIIGFCALAAFFPKGLFPDSNRILPMAAILLAFVAFAMRLVKQDQVCFYEKDGTFAFLINLSKPDREYREQVVAFIVEKIESAESLPRAK